MYPHEMALFAPTHMGTELLPGPSGTNGHETMTRAGDRSIMAGGSATCLSDARLRSTLVFNVVAHDGCNDASKCTTNADIGRRCFSKGTRIG